MIRKPTKVALCLAILAGLGLAIHGFSSRLGFNANVPACGVSGNVPETQPEVPIPSVRTANRDAAIQAMKIQSLHFEPNVGQTNEQVKFIARGLGYAMFLTGSEAVMVLNMPGDEQSKTEGSLIGTAGGVPGTAVLEHPEPTRQQVVRINVEGNNPIPKPVGLEKQASYSNYFLGDDPAKWRPEVPHFRKAKFEDVYPGIDLVYYGNQGQLEYDFVIKPGGNPELIRLSIDGAERISLDDGGNLVLGLAGGIIVQKAPIVYQVINGTRKPIPGRYILKSNERIGFSVCGYDPNRELVVDPVLVYSTYLGGSVEDIVQGLAVDSNGAVFVTGFTHSQNSPIKNPMQGSINSTWRDVILTKLAPDGKGLVFSTYLGGAYQDTGQALALDKDGAIYLTGWTNSYNFPTQNPYQGANAGGGDVFVTKVSGSGSSLVFSTYLGGSTHNGENGQAIVVDMDGGVYVVGVTDATDFPTYNAIQPSHRGGVTDAFIFKLNTPGSSPAFSTYLGGAGADFGLDLAIDANKAVYVSGYTESADFPTRNPVQNSLRGTRDVFIAKINPQGNALVYSTYLGGSGSESTIDYCKIAVDANGAVYVAAGTDSTDFPVVNAIQSANGGGRDVFISQLKPDGSEILYSTYFGGSEDDVVRGMAIDATGAIYVSGHTYSANFPVRNAFQSALAGVCDVFLLKLQSGGQRVVFSSYLGGSAFDEGSWEVALGPNHGIYLASRTASTDFPTKNPYQAVAGGGDSDGYIVKIDDNTPFINGLSPSSGLTNGGAVVTINGTNFASGATVTFGGATGTSVNIESSTKLTCNAPAHAAGPVDVVVTNPDQQTATLPNGFTYNAPDNTNRSPAINSGPTSDKRKPFENETINFSVSASDPDKDNTLTYSWDFGDGTTDTTGPNVSHAYSAHNTYTVTVTVSDGKTSVSGSLTQIVYSRTAPNITQGPTASPNPAVVNGQVLFSAQASNAAGETITLTWYFGDGVAITDGSNIGANVNHSYSAAGSYTVTLTAADPNNQSTTGTVVVTVTEQGGGGTESGTMTVLKIKLKLNFAKEGKDMVMVQGEMDIPADFKPENATVDVDISGVFGSFVLDSKGKATTDASGSKDKKFMLMVKYKKGELQTAGVKFTFAIKNGDFADTWRTFGLENGNVEAEVSVPMAITTSTRVYGDFLKGDYKATEGRMGQFVGKEGLSLGGR